MAIIYPSSCRNITSGALRQIKHQGVTTAGTDGGAVLVDYYKFVAQDTGIYASKKEPTGIFMSNLDDAKISIDNTTNAISESVKKMVSEAEKASVSLTDSSRKMRDATDKLSAQMQKFYSTFGNAKFDEQAKAAQSLADALEKLSQLEEKGMLSKVMMSLNAKS